MKLKNKMIVICLIFFILISISAVSAANNNSEIITNNNNDGDILSVNSLSDKEILSTGEGSFADLNTTINGDSSTTIELDKDYAYTGSDNFTNGITINKNNLTIDGKGHTIDAKGQSRIFYITSTTVILKNIKFVNGNAKQGGAIYGYGDNLRVYNCTFVNNNASGWGGAVYSYPDSLAIFANSTFTNNHAKYGGAISNIYGYKQYVINCSFYSNQATDYGGAVLVYGVQPTTERPYADQFYIVGCKFIDNNAPIGDAISNLHSATLNITNCILLGNASNIIDAETYFTYADYNWFGNTYDNRSVSPNIVKYVKVNNWLYMDLVPQIETASATVSINNLYNNKTGETSTYTTSRLPSIDVDIRAVNANLSSDKVSLDNTGKAEINFALLGDCELMATYESSSVSKKIKGGSFAELQKLIRAANDGDTIVLQKDYVYIKGVDVMTQGIQIEDKHDLVIDGNGHIINAGGNTRVFAVDKQSNHITFKNMNIVNGYVYSDASGAGLVMESDYSQIINCTFINNTANSLNGGAALYGHATHTNVTGCRFINNTQEYSAAGALYWRGEDLTISNTLFENNYALDHAGAVEVYDGGNIYNCTFAYNKADYAGAIFNYGHINIDSCTFIGNEALDEDGLKAGGAIYTGNATITKTTFVYNKARIGAAIATAGKGVLIEECIFINNTANSANGIIFVMAEGGQVINSIFLNNSVLYNGYVISGIAANFKADYNWFGHTWKNYKTNWDVSNLADMTKWLFLNATDIIFDEDTGSLKTSFTFMEYDSSTGKDIHYDVGELPAVNLTLSSQNLTLNKNAVNVGDDIDGTTTNYKGLLVAQYENVKYELPFKYLNQSSIVVNSTINVIKGDTENFHFSVLPFEDDYIPFLINSNRITITCNDTSVAKIVKKNFNYKIQGLKLGLAEITIKFNGIDVVGRDKYTPATATILVNVTRCPTHIKLIYNVSDMEVGDSGNIVAILNDYKNKSATGSLEYINNNETVLRLASGSFRALAEGLANVTIVFAGNTNYEPCSLEVTFNVGRKPTTITVDSNELEMKPGNIHYLGPSISGPSVSLFNCTSNDTDVATINEEGHVTAIGPGIAKLTIRYEGNERYLPAVTYVTVKVSRIPTHIEVEPQKELNKSDSVSIGAVLKDDNNKTVLVPPIYPDQNYTKVYTVNDTSVLTIDENGYITAVGVGTAKVTIEFRGYQEYSPSNATVTVKVVSPKNKITVEPEINIHVGENKYVNATLQYRILSNLQYVSNDTKVVSVDKNGKLTGIAEGTAEITILLKDDKKFSDANATAIVRVTKGVTTIDAPDTISLYIDGADYIRANLTSEWENKRLYNLIYESSNNRIVKVDKSTGLIRALKEGQANITISFKESNKYYGAFKNVLVTVTLIPTTINVGKTVSLFTGESELINASLMPSGIGSLTFVSSDDKVASVDENGLITAVGAGQANITVSFNGNTKYAPTNETVLVTVTQIQMPTSIDVNKNIELYVFNSTDIGAVLNPANAGKLIYVSSNSSVVSVDENGLITANGVGEADITVKFEGSAKFINSSETVHVKVKAIPTTMSADSSITVLVGENKTISYIFSNPEAGDVEFVIDDSSVAVIKDGAVVGNKMGKTNLTVLFKGNKNYIGSEATIVINVIKGVTEISAPDTVSLHVGDSVSLNASLTSENKTLSGLVYESSNNDVVGVDENGLITALKSGQANITVRFAESDKYYGASKKVSVSVSLIPTTIDVGKTFSLLINEQEAINAILNPSEAGNLTFTSSDNTVVSIDENGLITALGEGKANITVSFKGDGKYASASETVLVTVSQTQMPTSIDVDKNIELYVFNSTDIGAVLNPANAGKLTYVSSNSSVVSVDENGLITAKAVGEADITVKFTGDSRFIGSSETVHVKVIAIPTSIEADKSVTIYVGENATVSYIFSNPEAGDVEFIMGNSSVASIKDGIVLGNKVGKTNLTVLFKGNKNYMPSNATILINVIKAVTQITAPDTISLNVADNLSVNATLTSDNKTLSGLIYESSNSDIVKVDKNTGAITAVGAGQANITVSFAESDKYYGASKKVLVTVSLIPTTINVGKIVSLIKGQKDLITAILSPSEAGNLTFTSSDDKVASVDENGLITAVGAGQANITVSFKCDGKYASANATVLVTVTQVQMPTSIEVNNDVEMYVFNSTDIGAVLNPANAGKLTYSSTNSSVVSVDENGLITAKGVGEADILVNFAGNDKFINSSETVHVKVMAIPTTIDADKSMTINLTENATIDYIFSNPEAGNVEFIIEDASIISIKDGIATANKVGKTNVTVIFKGNKNYVGSNATVLVEVADVKTAIEASDISVNMTETAKIGAVLTPGEAGKLAFVSSNESVVTVDENGVITGVSVGEADIVISFAGKGKYHESTKTVHVKVTDVETVIAANNLTVNITGTGYIGASLTPKVGDLTYKSSNESVVTVDEKGKITGVSVGEADIVISFAGKGKYRESTKTVHVKVTDVETVIYANDLTINVTEKDNIKARLAPNIGTLSYKSSNESVVSVNERGDIVGVNVGEADITISFAGKTIYRESSKTIHVKVVYVVTEINVNDTISVFVDDSQNIGAVLNPYNKFSLNYTSSNDTIVSVDKDGNIVAHKQGSAVITVSFEGKGKYAPASRNVTVVVSRIPTEIRIDDLDLEIGSGQYIHPSVYPTPRGHNELIYISSNESIVETNGSFIFSKQGGNVTITMIYPGDDKYLPSNITMNITVHPRVTKIIAPETIEIGFGESQTINATLDKDSRAKLTFESSNPEIASVDKDTGRITALDQGNATITIKFVGHSSYYPAEAIVKVVVTSRTTEVKVDKSSFDLHVDDQSRITATVVNAPEGSNVTYISSNIAVVSVDKNGIITANGEGTAIITVLYMGDEDYHSSSANVSVSVSRFSTRIVIDHAFEMKVFDNTNLRAVVNPGEGIMTYKSSNETVVTVNPSGIMTANAVGSAVITITYAGDRLYLPSQKEVIVSVFKVPTSINLTDIELYAGDELKLSNVVTPVGVPTSSRYMTFESYDLDVFDVDSKGVIYTMYEGIAELYVEFKGNDIYLPSNATVMVKVIKRTLTADECQFGIEVSDDQNEATFTLNVPEDAEGSFMVTVDGIPYAEYVEDGTAQMVISELTPGDHKVTMRYTGDLKYASVTNQTTIHVYRIKIDKNKDVSVAYTDRAVYKVHLTRDTQAMENKTVTFKINGKTYYGVTDMLGYASVKLPKLPIKTYTITASYKGIKVTNKITSKHIVVAKDLKAKKTKPLSIKITLNKVNNKVLKYKKVTLKFNGKTYTGKTNSKGVVTFTIAKSVLSKLKVGKSYTYKVTYSKDTVSKKIKIVK